MNFKNVDINDMPLVLEFFQRQNSRMSDFTLGTFFEWTEYLETQFAVLNDKLYIRFFDRAYGHYVYATANVCDTVEQMEEIIDNVIAEVNGQHAVILAAFPEEKLSLVSEKYQIRYSFERMWSDYLYDAQSFRTFSGKKLHSKRNHISRFIREYGEPELVPIDEANINDALEFLDEYSKTDDHSELYEYELKKSKEAIRNMKSLKMFGALLKIDHKTIGLTAGTILGDTLFVHIEKAQREYLGAYTVLANRFANMFPTIQYINREDDAGDEGLRKSKLSYYPIKLIDKYVVHIDAKK